MRYTTTIRSAMLAAAVFAALPVMYAQEQEDPGRTAARISLINGEVSVRRGDSGEWVAAAINAPLVLEDRISTGPSSRAEVQLDSANIIRLGANSEVRVAQLEYHRYRRQVPHGTVTYHVLRDSQ